MSANYQTYSVSPRAREPLVRFMLDALRRCGCEIIKHSGFSEAPFRMAFQTPMGERMGIVAYAFLANSRTTRNRPADEHRFQIKYSSKDSQEHELWQDPYEVYTTLLLGINPERGVFVGADPVLHSPTRFFISIEFKEHHAERILRDGWSSWQRDRRRTDSDRPIEILVGGTAETFLQYVRFEQAAKGIDQGHRQLLAEKFHEIDISHPSVLAPQLAEPTPEQIHDLSKELALTEAEIMDLIQSAPRLKMAVRGWVAEVHLVSLLETLPGVSECVRIEEDGRPDVSLRFQGSRPLTIECKNVLRKPLANGGMRVDFQKTRSSKSDPCSRFYGPEDFHVVAACLHPRTEMWEFKYALARELDPHKKCVGKLSNLVRVDSRWCGDATPVLSKAMAAS